MVICEKKLMKIITSPESSEQLALFAARQLVISDEMNMCETIFGIEMKRRFNLPNTLNDPVYRKAINLYFKYSKNHLGTGKNANTLANKIGHYTNWIGESLEERRIPKDYDFINTSSEDSIIKNILDNEDISGEYLTSFTHVFDKYEKNPIED
jgi:hypothetical protein